MNYIRFNQNQIDRHHTSIHPTKTNRGISQAYILITNNVFQSYHFKISEIEIFTLLNQASDTIYTERKAVTWTIMQWWRTAIFMKFQNLISLIPWTKTNTQLPINGKNVQRTEPPYYSTNEEVHQETDKSLTTEVPILKQVCSSSIITASSSHPGLQFVPCLLFLLVTLNVILGQ